MKIKNIEVYWLNIPFKRRFKHAASEKSETENLITKVTLENNSSGYGESIPRIHVTGEILEDSAGALVNYFIPQVLDKDFSSFEECVEFLKRQKEFSSKGVVYNSAKCSLELALLDAYGKCFRRNVSEIGELVGIKTKKKGRTKKYSYVFSIDKKTNRIYSAGLYFYGFRDFKFKIDSKCDFSQIEDFRKHLRKKISSGKVILRADANSSLNEESLDKIISELSEIDVFYLEQPLTRGKESALCHLKGQYPIILDESLCSLEDARKAIDGKYGDIFNIRLSKNGGLINSLEMYKLAEENNMQCQLGCMVGETGILTAAGRHFVSIADNLVFAEGGYGKHLLREDITIENMGFGFGAFVYPVFGHGLGIHVNEEKLKKYAKKKNSLKPRA